ncbi:glutamate decarboxylase [Shewanella sp. GXUN23E]|uniref:glutamate decarboxylase n=1 Tax=Shewanella sp. GXUN23E TaxID=3422498 RepID=UPI003D7E3601
MALHSVKPGQDLTEDIYDDPTSATRLSKFTMPVNSTPADVIAQLLRDELLLDGNARQNFATFCSTWLEPEIHQLMDLCIDKNMIDKDEYPQTAELEARCVHMLAALWHSPAAGTTLGCSTTGSSEAAMLGGLAMKWRWRKAREAAGLDAQKPNLVCGPVQICWHKFARYFDVELREVPLDGDEVGMNPDKLQQYVDENTIGVVATLGVTYTCVYEPVKAICEALDHIEQTQGWNIPVHVDGASGGFVAPFVQSELDWDFRLERVKSINASGHKFGLAPLGVGWVVWRSKEDLPQELIFTVDYLGGNMPTFALNFSRPGGQIVAQYFLLIRLGFEGYRKIHQACMDTAQWMAGEIAAMGPFELFYDGHGGLPALSYTLKAGEHGFSLYDLSDRLRMRGWQIASYPLPENRQQIVIQRIMVRHGLSRDLASLLIRDIKSALAFFSHTPASRPSFSHG